MSGHPPEPDVQAILELVRAVLEADEPLAEAGTQARTLTNARLVRAAEGLAISGIAVSAELRQRRRGESARVV